MVVVIKDSNEKRAIAREVLEDLTQWFEVEESRVISQTAQAGLFLRQKTVQNLWAFCVLRKREMQRSSLRLKALP